MNVRKERKHRKRKEEIMEKCYDCYAEHGLNSVGIKVLAKACEISSGSLYFYFENLDELIIESTEHCMSKVENEFMQKAPQNAEELEKFIDEIPYWTAEKHGKKYRLMYQVYTHPKYIKYGQRFFDGINKRYSEYAAQLEIQIGIPRGILTSLIFILVRTCVHYAMFEDEFYLQAQLNVLKSSIRMFREKYASVGLPEENNK